MFLKENAFFFKVTKAVKKPEEEEPKPEKPKVEPKPVEKIKKPEGTNKKKIAMKLSINKLGLRLQFHEYFQHINHNIATPFSILNV